MKYLLIFAIALLSSCRGKEVDTVVDRLKSDTISIGDTKDVDPGITVPTDRTYVADTAGVKVGPVH